MQAHAAMRCAAPAAGRGRARGGGGPRLAARPESLCRSLLAARCGTPPPVCVRSPAVRSTSMSTSITSARRIGQARGRRADGGTRVPAAWCGWASARGPLPCLAHADELTAALADSHLLHADERLGALELLLELLGALELPHVVLLRIRLPRDSQHGVDPTRGARSLSCVPTAGRLECSRVWRARAAGLTAARFSSSICCRTLRRCLDTDAACRRQQP